MPTLGKYQIEAEIGRGAMGVVYRALDPQIGRQVAIKTIFVNGQEPEDQAAYRERFFQEARAAGRLAHPGIVTIFDAGQDAETGDPYIVMENVDGQSLSRILIAEGGKLSVGPALQLAQEIAEALSYAHQQGVIHRDIKPGNILVTRDGHIKIADFGVARLNESEMTMPGQILGSPAYMSPEQLRGDEIDARSDLFSLGVLLYRILTGYRPFQGNSVHTVAFKVANYEPMPASSFESGLPAEIDAIVSRALTKDLKGRYQSAAELAHDLGHLRDAMGLLDKTAGQLSAVSSPKFAGTPTMANASSIAPRPRLNVPATRKLPRQSWSHFPTWLVYSAAMALAISLFAFWLYFRQQPSTSMSINVGPHLVPPPIEKVQTSEAPVQHLPQQQPQRVAHKVNSPPLGSAGNLLVEIDHPFHQGDASVWVDDQLVYDEALQPGARSLLFRKKGSSTHTVPVSPGKHTVRVHVADPAEKYDASQTLAWTAASGQQSILMVHCDKVRNLLTTSLK